MFEKKLTRTGFILRPVRMADEDAIFERLFSDVEVAKTLMHNVSPPANARKCSKEWCDYFAVDSEDEDHCEPGLGLWAICEPRADGDAGNLVGVRGLFRDPALAENTVEGFAAIARSHWRRGLSSDSSAALLSYAFRELGLDAVYTNIWPLLNPASESVQRRVGYEHVGRTTVLESFGADRIVDVMEFELWRLAKASDADRDQVFREAGIKLGQLSAEGNLTLDIVRERVAAVLSDEDNRNAVFAHMDAGYANPGWATYRLTKATWAAKN